MQLTEALCLKHSFHKFLNLTTHFFLKSGHSAKALKMLGGELIQEAAGLPKSLENLMLPLSQH